MERYARGFERSPRPRRLRFGWLPLTLLAIFVVGSQLVASEAAGWTTTAPYWKSRVISNLFFPLIRGCGAHYSTGWHWHRALGVGNLEAWGHATTCGVLSGGRTVTSQDDLASALGLGLPLPALHGLRTVTVNWSLSVAALERVQILTPCPPASSTAPSEYCDASAWYALNVSARLVDQTNASGSISAVGPASWQILRATDLVNSSSWRLGNDTFSNFSAGGPSRWVGGVQFSFTFRGTFLRTDVYVLDFSAAVNAEGMVFGYPAASARSTLNLTAPSHGLTLTSVAIA